MVSALRGWASGVVGADVVSHEEVSTLSESLSGGD